MGKSKAFKVKVGVHHDSVFSPLLFIIVLKALSSEFREGFWNCFMWMIFWGNKRIITVTEEGEAMKRVDGKEGNESEC